MRKIILFIYLFQLSLLANAGHRPGGSYTWECIGPNTYKIRYTGLVDCAHAIDATTKFCLTGSLPGDPNNGNYNINLVSSATTVVPQPVVFCTGVPDCQGGGDYNWVTSVIYERTITLSPPISPSYTIEFCDGGGRPNADNSAGANFYNQATFSIVVPCNSSAYPTSFPDVFYCKNEASCIINNFVDPDGDSLAFSLGNCLEGIGNPINYILPYSATNPLNSTSGWSIDSIGNICFFPTIAMKGPVCMNIKEYRGGVLIATTTQDIFINVIDCPYALTGPSISGITSTAVSCFGGTNGTATVTATGGASPYTYSWAPSGGTAATTTGRPAGTYTVTVNSASGCSSTATVTITQPLAPVTATIASTNVLCNGAANGTATATPAGGSPGYTYLWSPSGGTAATATGLSPGNYTVTVKDINLCQTTASVIITQPPVLNTAITSSINVTCFGSSNGSATVNANGGTPPYSYSWNSTPVQTTSTATGLPAGSYTVTVTDSKGCTSTKPVTITQPAAITLTTVQTNVSCFNGSNGTATVTVAGGTPGYTYSWLPSGGTSAAATTLTAGTYTITVTDTKGCTGSTTVTITQPAAISLTLSSTNVSCFGGNNGTATVSATGGTPGYTYAWTPSGGSASIATNLTAGTYTVAVTDSKGCIGTASVTISQPIVISATTTTTNVSCNGGSDGSASVSVSGGTLPYTYLWSPGGSTLPTANGLPVGSYTVTITDNNGCIITRVVSITQPTSVNASVIGTNVSCNGGNNGAATVTASGGTPAYTYSWSTSPIQTTATASGLTAGTFIVTVTDSKGCTGSAIINITQPAALTATISSSTNVNCFGGNNGSATVSVGGGTPGYTYNWVPSGGGTSIATNIAAGTYTVNITDSKGCTITASVTITQPTLLSANTTAAAVSCNGGNNGSATVTATGGTPGYTYSWSPSGGSSSVATGLTAGNYTVTVTDNKGCQATANANVSQPSGMTLTTTSVNATCSSSNGQASVSVTGGNPGYTYSWNSAPIQTTSTATGLPAGSYVITVTDASGCIKTATVIVSNNAAPAASIVSTTQVSCNGGSNGSATASVTGGTTPYSYNWSPAGGSSLTATGLSAGTYTFTATDANGCIATTITTITQPTALSLTTSQTNVSCNGGNNGTASVVASGGSFGYTYNWSPAGGTGSTATGLTAGSFTVTVTDNKGCIATTSFIITQPLVLSATTIINNNVSCNGGSNGSASVNPTGGTAGYIYSWSPTGGSSSTAIGLSAGSYTVTVTDSKGCQATAIAFITQPAPIGIAMSSTNVLCNGGNSGSATATASSGTSPYTYFWTPVGISGATASGLTSGTYTVIVTDANGCQGSAPITITQPSILTVATSTINVSCFGGANGSATGTASGGSPSYSYSWSTVPVQTTANAIGLAAGTYTLTLTDNNGCVTAANVAITEPTPLSLTTSQTNVSCNGGNNGSATVTVSGGTPSYTYNWTPTGGITANANGLNSGTYTVTVTDTKGCTASASVTITQPILLTSSVTASTNVSCNGGNNGSATASAAGGTPGYTYLWAPSGGASSIATGLSAGSYTVTTTDTKSCTSSSTVVITQPAGLSGSVVSVANVSCNGGSNGAATVSASGGTSPYTYSWLPYGGSAATATGLTSGTYTITINDANSCSYSLTVTITQPSQLTASITATNVTCNGGNNGSASVIPAGGNSPYTYSWSTVPVQTGSTATNLVSGTYTVTVTDGNGCTAITSVNITAPSGLFITSTQVNVSCNGGNNGTASVNVSGGTPGYAYNWIPSGGSSATGSGFSAGTYTVITTDAVGCTGTSSVTITQPSLLSMSVTINNHVSCNGGNNGSATIIAAGGTPGYNYSWTPGGLAGSTENSLGTGTYTVTTTDSKGCTSTSSVIIIQPSALAISISATNVSCNGGSDGTATAIVTGGTSPYTYQWLSSGGTSASATGLIAGTYTVTATDANGCTISSSVAITQPAILAAGLTSSANVTCFGACNGTAQIMVSGGTPPYAYSWSPGGQSSASVNNLCAGTHTVTITDSKGCLNSITVTITQPAIITTINTITNVNCYNACNGSATVVASGGVGPYSFLWNPGFQTTPNVIGMCAGTYTVTITDANSCFVNVPIAITQPTATTLTTSVTNANCGSNNGGACVIVAGGAPPYTYQWNDPLMQTTSCATNLTGNSYTVTVTDFNGCVYQAVANVNNISGPSVSIAASTNITCAGFNNGTATASIGLGTPPYTILWSPGGQTTAFVTGLGGGLNTITVTDNAGCIASATVTITEPPVLGSAITSSANITCNGLCNGTATVAAGGGVSPYSYSWNSTPVQTTPTANSLCAGGYTVTVVDANGCATTSSRIITQPAVISVATLSVTNVSCNGGSNGSIQVSATGGTPGYTYLWSPSGGSGPLATGLSAGSYTLTVTDVNGCASITMYSVTEPTVLTSSMTHTNITCHGDNDGTASVTINGGSPGYTYSWLPSSGSSPSISVLSPGAYIVTATDIKGCTIQDTAIITEPSLILINVSSTIVTCFGGNNGTASAAVSGGTPGYTYSWNSSPVQTTATAINLTEGDYTITVTDANGCVEAEEVDVFENSEVIVSSVSSASSCNGGNNGSVSAIVIGGTPGYSYSWIPGGASTSTVNGLAAGTYSVTVTDALGCAGTDTATVIQPALLSASASVVSNVSCNGGNNGALLGSVTGGTPGYFYLWSPSGGTMPNATNLYAGTYILTIIDANNCQDTASVNITEPSAITSSITQTNVSCFGGNNGSASVTVTGGSPGYTYLWSPSGGTNSTATGLAANNYTITVTDNNGCTESIPVTITQPQLLTASISANTNLSCFAVCDGTAIASATDGTGPYSYLWLPISVSSASVNNLCAGSYTVVATDNNGCQSMDSIIINQPVAITNVVTSNNVNCFSSCDGSAGIITTGGVGPYTFLWSSGGQTSPFVSSLCANTYTVSVTDNNGCTRNEIIPISEPSPILNSITVTSATCGNANGSLAANTSGGTPPYSYQWNDPLLQTTATATNLTAGNYIVNITDANGCVLTSNSTVPGTTNPVITSITGISPSCYGTPTGSATVTVTSGASPYTYLWNDPFSQTNSTATGLTVGTYIVLVTDNNGCIITDSISLTQPTQVQTIISANDSSLCYGQSVQMFCSGVGGNPGYTYYWSTGYVGAGPVTYSPTSATIYSVYSVDATGCQSLPASITVTVGSPITVSAPNVSACAGQPAIISAAAAGGTSGPYTYTWSNGYVGQNQSVTLFSNQTYIVTVGDGCSSLAFDTVVVTVNPLAVGNMILSDTSGCEPFTIQLSGSSDIGITYTWNFGDGSLNVNGVNVSHTYTTAGSYFVTLTITTATGCQSSITNIQPVTVKPSPTAYFSVSPSITPIPNATDLSFTNLSTGAISYIWNFGDGNTSNAVNPTHYYALTGEYLMQLVAMNSLGCIDTFSLKSTSENYIHFANAFTPNPNGGNGGTYNFYELNNDVFFPTSAGIEEFHMMIYNKWGEVIFESFDINKGWDGYYKGKICEQDVYVWKAFATFKDGNKYVGAGDVTLLR